MSIANVSNSSARDNLTQLLHSKSEKLEGLGPSSSGKTSDPEVKRSAPAAVVDLSDRAKAMLKRTEADQIVADRLAEQIASTKSEGKRGPAGTSASEQTKAPTLNDILGDGPKPGTSSLQPKSLSQDSERQQAIIESNRQPDGTVKSFSVTERDVLTVPSTPAEVEEWFNTRGKAIIGTAQRIPEEEATGIADAVRNRTIKIFSAKDIPGLNFTNTYTFSGGESGAQGNGTHSYNRDADIFKDPNTNYRVDSTGTVLAWPKSVTS